MSRNYKQTKNSRSMNKGSRQDKAKAYPNQKVSREQKTNNPSWYTTNDAIVQGVANLPFNMPTGSSYRLFDEQKDCDFTFTNHYGPVTTTPGIAVFDVIPSFGDQRDPSSSLNIAAQAIYTWVRYYNSGARNYTPADLMIYLVANAQVYSMINWAMRIYGTISLYDHRNKYLGKTLLKSMNIDYDDFIGRMAEYRGRLNLLINKAASFVVPNTMTYFLRTASMYTDIYTDGSTIKDQLYLYNPVGFYFYNFDTSETPKHDGSYLQWSTLTTDDHLMTVDDVIAYIDMAISRLINSHDQGVISGDLYKAYGGNILTLAEMAEGYRTNIVHDEWVLNQMKNSTITSFWSYPELTQNPEEGTIVFDPTYTFSKLFTDEELLKQEAFQLLGMHGDRVLTVGEENPGTDKIMEYTRMMTILDDVSYKRTGGQIDITGRFVSGSEIILRARFYYSYADVVGGPLYIGIAHYWHYCRCYTDANIDAFLLMDTMKRYFKYFPATIKFRTNGNQVSSPISVMGLDLDVDNYTLIDSQELKHLHDVALMNMFATDAVAKLK